MSDQMKAYIAHQTVDKEILFHVYRSMFRMIVQKDQNALTLLGKLD